MVLLHPRLSDMAKVLPQNTPDLPLLLLLLVITEYGIRQVRKLACSASTHSSVVCQLLMWM